MTILKTDLSLFNNIVGWEFKENFLTVASEFGEINIHYVDENQDRRYVIHNIMICSIYHRYRRKKNHKPKYNVAGLN